MNILNIKKVKETLNNKNGFTLLEVVIGIAIATIVFIGTFNSITSMTNVNREANLKREAHSQIINIAEEINDNLPMTKENIIPIVNAYRNSPELKHPLFPNYSPGVTRYETKLATVKNKEAQTDTLIVIDISDANIIKIRVEKRTDLLTPNGSLEGNPYILPVIDEVLVWRNN